MKNSDRDRFDGRLKNASEANRDKLERFKAAANDPERQAKRAEKQALAVAHQAARKAKAAKLLEEEEARARQQAETAAREAEQAAVREAALEKERAETAEQEMAHTKARDAERKAERDRRYAARRNRKR